MSASQQWGEVVSFDSEASLLASFSRTNSSLCCQGSPRTNCTSNSTFLANNNPGFDCREPSVSSPDIMSSTYYYSNMRGLDDSPFEYVQTLAFPSQVSSSILNCDSVSLNNDFSNEDHLQFFETPTTDLESVNSGFTTKHSFDANSRAQRRWRKLFNVFKWISVRNLVVARNRPVQDASVSVAS